MFKVRDIVTGAVVTVYAVVGLRFMIWDDREGGWAFRGIDGFEPLVEE